MSKVIELAREAGICIRHTDECDLVSHDELTKLYTLARADLNDKVVSLEAENARKEEIHVENYAGFAESINKLEAENAKLKHNVSVLTDALVDKSVQRDALESENAKLRKALSDLLNSEWQDDDGDERLESARKQAREAAQEHADALRKINTQGAAC